VIFYFTKLYTKFSWSTRCFYSDTLSHTLTERHSFMWFLNPFLPSLQTVAVTGAASMFEFIVVGQLFSSRAPVQRCRIDCLRVTGSTAALSSHLLKLMLTAARNAVQTSWTMVISTLAGHCGHWSTLSDLVLPSCESLSIILDNRLSMSEQVTAICRACVSSAVLCTR